MKRTEQYTINGKTYTSLDEMPPEVRKEWDSLFSQFDQFLPRQNDVSLEDEFQRLKSEQSQILSAANNDDFNIHGMVKRIRVVVLIVLFFCSYPFLLPDNKIGPWLSMGQKGMAEMIGLASLVGVIYFQFRRWSVKALIWTQGLEMICLISALLLLLYSAVYEGPLYPVAPLYYLSAYCLIALVAIFYGRRYAIKRWGPRAKWLGEYARSNDTIPGDVLYANFFESPDPNIKKKLAWIGGGGATATTYMLRHRYGYAPLDLTVSMMMTWASFAMFSNLIIRSRLLRRCLGNRDLKYAE